MDFIWVNNFSILLSWGHNLGWLTHLFFDYFPLYSKFRSITMILVIVEIAIPIIAVIGLSKFLENDSSLKNIRKKKRYINLVLFFFLLFVSFILQFKKVFKLC